MDLVKRRDQIIAEHKAMEKHNPAIKAQAARGDRLSDRPIAFLCDDEVVVIGDDVGKVLAGVQKFVDEHSQRFDDPAVQAALAHDHGCLKRCRKLLASPPSGELRVGQQVWNSYLHGLGEVGVQVVLADGTFLPKE